MSRWMPEAPEHAGPQNRPGDAAVGWRSSVRSSRDCGVGRHRLVDRLWLHTWVGIVVGMLVGFAGAIYLIIASTATESAIEPSAFRVRPTRTDEGTPGGPWY